jgi:hypothetical protein
MSGIRKAMFVTDDRDRPRDKQSTLVIFPGGNGDWYVQVAPNPDGRVMEAVRISTSGGAQFAAPGLGIAIAEAYRALIAAEDGVERPQTQHQMAEELAAWRAKFPNHSFDGLDISRHDE